MDDSSTPRPRPDGTKDEADIDVDRRIKPVAIGSRERHPKSTQLYLRIITAAGRLDTLGIDVSLSKIATDLRMTPDRLARTPEWAAAVLDGDVMPSMPSEAQASNTGASR